MKLTGPVAFNFNFFPFPEATLSFRSWDFVSLWDPNNNIRGTTGCQVKGDHLRMKTRSIWSKPSFSLNKKACVRCYPSVCSCVVYYGDESDSDDIEEDSDAP